MRAVFKKELSSYFYTSLGYVYIGVFLSIASLLFAVGNLGTQSADLSEFFSMMSYVWMLLTPILVMRLIAGERKQKTDQLLLTAPLRVFDIIMGKYLAACAVLIISIALSFVYPLLIALQSRVYPAELATAYLGFALQGCAFIALDLMLSCLTRNPVTSVAFTFGANLLLWLAILATSAGGGPLIRAIDRLINLYGRFAPFTMGQLSFANILYFLAFSAFCLLLASQLLRARRWSEAS